MSYGRNDILPDHPDIESALRTGYPRYMKEAPHYCQECGEPLDGGFIYEDESHDFLCWSCLMTLHKKESWEW